MSDSYSKLDELDDDELKALEAIFGIKVPPWTRSDSIEMYARLKEIRSNPKPDCPKFMSGTSGTSQRDESLDYI